LSERSIVFGQGNIDRGVLARRTLDELSTEGASESLAAMPGKLVAILDACHSGSVADTFKAGGADDLVRELVGEDYGVIVMCSSLGSEVSLESSETKGSFFTTGLVEGLNGRADFNKDKVVWIHELDAYATLRTRQLRGGEQNSVTVRPPTIKPFPLSRP